VGNFDLRLPNITGEDADTQLKQMSSYLYQMVEQLNWALNTSNASETAVVQYSENGEVIVPDDSKSLATFESIKDLIIKSADIVDAYSEQMRHTLKGAYVATSEFGKYFSTAELDFEGTPTNLTQFYRLVEGIDSDVKLMRSTNAYIKEGMLDIRGDGVPVFGIEVGQITKDEEGKELYNAFARFTSNGIYLYNADSKVPSAEFSTDSLVAKNLLVYDNQGRIIIKADSSTRAVEIAGFSIDSNKMKKDYSFNGRNGTVTIDRGLTVTEGNSECRIEDAYVLLKDTYIGEETSIQANLIYVSDLEYKNICKMQNDGFYANGENASTTVKSTGITTGGDINCSTLYTSGGGIVAQDGNAYINNPSIKGWVGSLLLDRMPKSGGIFSGNVGVDSGDETDTYVRVKNSANNAILLTNYEYAGVYHNSSSGYRNGKWLIYMDKSGIVTCASGSDRRLKNDLGEISDREALSLLAVQPHLFTYKADEKKIVQHGFMAQDIRDVLIENEIGYRPFINIYTKDREGYETYDLNTPEEEVEYGIDYSKFVPILWKGWQIHEREIKELKEQVKTLTETIKEMRKEE